MFTANEDGALTYPPPNSASLLLEGLCKVLGCHPKIRLPMAPHCDSVQPLSLRQIAAIIRLWILTRIRTRHLRTLIVAMHLPAFHLVGIAGLTFTHVSTVNSKHEIENSPQENASRRRTYPMILTLEGCRNWHSDRESNPD